MARLTPDAHDVKGMPVPRAVLAPLASFRSDDRGRPVTFQRFVAIGDSTAEGLDDPDGHGGYRGWADRLAEHLAEAFGDVRYANLAVRGRRTHEVLEDQLPAALRLEPDLVAVAVGVNDILRPRLHLARVVRDLERINRALVRAGATVVTFTQPDPTPVMPVARPLRGRVRAFNHGLRRAGERTGAVVVDLATHPVASDPRLWSADRLHANTPGHARMAAALADGLGLPGHLSWQEPLPPSPARGPIERLAAEADWLGRYLLPWLMRRLRGRSSGDVVQAKRPEMRSCLPR